MGVARNGSFGDPDYGVGELWRILAPSSKLIDDNGKRIGLWPVAPGGVRKDTGRYGRFMHH